MYLFYRYSFILSLKKKVKLTVVTQTSVKKIDSEPSFLFALRSQAYQKNKVTEV